MEMQRRSGTDLLLCLDGQLNVLNRAFDQWHCLLVCFAKSKTLKP